MVGESISERGAAAGRTGRPPPRERRIRNQTSQPDQDPDLAPRQPRFQWSAPFSAGRTRSVRQAEPGSLPDRRSRSGRSAKGA